MKAPKVGGLLHAGLVAFFLLCVCQFNRASEDASKESTSCDSIYNHTTGVVHYTNSSKTTSVEPDISCSWTFVVNETAGGVQAEVVLILEQFVLDADDSLTIRRNDSLPLDLGPFKGPMEPFMVSTGAKNITVTLKTSNNNFVRHFQLRYYMEYNFTYQMNNTMITTLLSPYYDKNRMSNVSANIKVLAKSYKDFKMSASLVSLNVNDNFMLTVADSEKRDGNYSGKNIPSELTGTTNLFFGLHIQPNKTLQQIKFAFEAVNEECSGTQELKLPGSTSFTLTNPSVTGASASETPSLNCRQIVFTKEGEGLRILVNAHNLTGPADQVLVQNVTCCTATPLVHLTADASWNDRYVLTNDKEVSMRLLSPFPASQLKVNVTVEILASGGYYEGGGSINLPADKSPAEFLLQVDPTKQLQFNFTTPKQGSIEFYSDFLTNSLPFTTLAELPQATAFVVSPGHHMRVSVKGFASEPLTASFGPVDQGYFTYGMEDSDSFTLGEKCLPITIWKITAKHNKTPVVEQRKLHFSTLLLTSTDFLRVVQKDTALVNVSGPLHHLDDLIYPSDIETSVILQRNCSKSGTVVVADYAPSPNCERNLTLTAGRSLSMSSPSYPNSYPKGTSCKWFISAPPSTVLHLSFDFLRLSSVNHSLQLYTVNGSESNLLLNLTGASTTLPRDYVVPAANLSVFFHASSQPSSINNQTSGFHFVVDAADCGGEMLDKDAGSLAIAGGKAPNTTDYKLCYWLVGLAPSAKGAPQKIFQYNSTTNSSSLKGYLEIHEGCSVRDVVSANLTGTNLLSRRDRLLFVYRNTNATASGPSVWFQYEAHACKDMCNNSICMHDNWRCNGINDCGDWTDEINCLGPQPTPPTPGPTPGPDPSKPVSGVSTTALALGILAALLIGALLGFAAPAAYRRIRSGQFGSSYSSFSNAADT